MFYVTIKQRTWDVLKMTDQFVFLDRQLQENAERILDEIGLDIKTVINMTLKRIVKEKSISFLLPNDVGSGVQHLRVGGEAMSNTEITYSKMTKNKAINLLRNDGAVFNGNVTFSSKNNGANTYWANPNFNALESNWYLILNDTVCRKIHLFAIPAKSISADRLVCRGDLPHLIDLQIMYDDISYTDTRSKMSFAKYMVKSLDY